MKRLILIVSTITCLSYAAQSQFRIGLVGGLHQSTVLEKNNLSEWIFDETIPDWDAIKKQYSKRTGVHLGFIADLPFSEKSNFYFRPGVLLFNKGRKFSFSSDSSTLLQRDNLPDTTVDAKYNYAQKQYLNYIDIPLNFVYKLKLSKNINFLIGGGPYVSFFLNGLVNKNYGLTGVSLTAEENKDLPVGKGDGQYRTMDFGVSGVAGFELGRVFITANYSRGLSDFYMPDTYTATEYKHEVMGVSLGVYLGKPVKHEPKDSDKDGIPDKDDKCPSLPGLPQFDGCPDTDGDGIPDGEDACPGIAGPKDNKGCPYEDSDKDGVLDKDDKCPTIAGLAKYNGCPIPDTDGDGINDEQDKCPEVAGLARYGGCPIPDTDGDGINDEEDACPYVKGLAEHKGCPPPVKEEIVEKVNYAAKQIQFKISSSSLLASSYTVLDEIVALLKENTDLKLAVEGHTSKDGSYEYNKKLSTDRANSVKTYLESKGIEAARITAEGFGPDKPLADGDTPADRTKNRRVELKLSNQ